MWWLLVFMGNPFPDVFIPNLWANILGYEASRLGGGTHIQNHLSSWCLPHFILVNKYSISPEVRQGNPGVNVNLNDVAFMIFYSVLMLYVKYMKYKL